MPLYCWKDKTSGKTIEVMKSFDEYKDPPTKEEAIAGGLTEEEADSADFVKVLGTGIKVVKGDSWGPGKGNWGRSW